MWWMVALALAAEPDLPDTEEIMVEVVEDAPRMSVSSLRANLPNALVIRGGAAKGAWQGGFVYYLTNFLRSERASSGGDAENPVDIITGASAGALNAMLAALSSCQPPHMDPTESLYYRSWVPLHIDPTGKSDDPYNLYRQDKVTRNGLLADDAFNYAAAQVFDELEDLGKWKESSCDVDLGLVVTRYDPRSVSLQTGTNSIRADRQIERFALHLHKDPGGLPHFQARLPVGDHQSFQKTLYLFPGLGSPDEPVELDAVKAILRASSGFPVAFKPVQIPHQEWSAFGDLVRDEETDNAWFVDGGFFENLPVKLAIRLAEWNADETPESGRDYLVLDTEIEAWSRSPSEVDISDEVPGDLVPSVLHFLGGYTNASGMAELVDAIETRPELSTPIGDPAAARPDGDLMYLPSRRTVIASSFVMSFLGFFEEDFRVFDFYSGMLEARWNLKSRFDRTPPDMGFDSPIFECFKAWDDASDGYRQMVQDVPEACGVLADQPNMLALLQTSTAYRLWTETDDYDPDEQLDAWVRLLDESGYVWKTFKQPRSGKELEQDVAKWLNDAMTRLSKKQESMAFATKVLTSTGVNTWAWTPTKWGVYGGIHVYRGFEVGAFGNLGKWFNLGAGLRVLNIGFRYERDDGSVGRQITPTPFARFAVTPMHNAIFQVEPYLGYQSEIVVDFQDGWRVARDSIEVGTTFVVAELAYLNMGLNGYIIERQNQPTGFDRVTPTQKVGFQLSLGVRFSGR